MSPSGPQLSRVVYSGTLVSFPQAFPYIITKFPNLLRQSTWQQGKAKSNWRFVDGHFKSVTLFDQGNRIPLEKTSYLIDR